MATLRQVLVGRPWWHSPVFWIAIAVLAVFAAGMVTANYTVWDTPSVPSLPSLQGEVSQPVAQPVQQAPVVVAPTVTLLTLRWEEYDWEKNPLGLGEYYRWGRDAQGRIYGDLGGTREGEFIGTGTAGDAIVYIKDVRMIGGSSREDPLEFSPDGEHWFLAANLPEQGAQIKGAVRDGNDILILANWQYEPWKYRHYIARVTPQDTKRASQ